ncbi:RNA polymerase sigma factor [Microbacterium testaceum]|uniref:RNA polymerase sigma factor n=1 Tax=Microbacterium testaceum TaxID=2033 RepID=UPI0022E71EBD|nr:sigma-70 family RNA polymerase sigma factor [Microbacterium testaceum]
MDLFEDKRPVGRHGTDIPTVQAVDEAVGRLVRRQWGGWSNQDQQDLQQQVMIKYFGKFGRDRLPDDEDGYPAVPIGWLMTVVRNAGVDLHRHHEARPADATDFQGTGGVGLDRLMLAVNPQPSLSTFVAGQVDGQRLLVPALQALGQRFPDDVKIIWLRYVDDLDVADVAQRVGKTPDATKKAIQRALKRLQESMS